MKYKLLAQVLGLLLIGLGVFLPTAISAAPGDLDPTFSFDGIAGVKVGSGADDAGYAAAIQPDGKIVVAGTAKHVYSTRCSLTRYNADGSFDTSFGGDGIVLLPSNDPLVCRSVAIQPDGKIVAAGTIDFFNGQTRSGAIVRVNPDGSPDTAFDGDGQLMVLNFWFNAVAVQPDGRIIAAGFAANGVNDNFPIARFNADGSPDVSFDNNGTLDAEINALAIQADGKIVAAGYGNGSLGDYALARFNLNGSFDNSFDGDGKVFTEISATDRANAVAIQTDGKIVAAGYSGFTNAFSLARYNPDGSLDATFDGDGKLMTSILSVSDLAYGVAIQTDGKIVAAGYSGTGSGTNFTLVRYNGDGSLDTAFDGDGKVTTPIENFTDYAYAVAIQTDGKIIAAGSTTHRIGTAGYNKDTVLTRYNADGSLDTSFDGNGILKVDIAVAEAAAYDIAIQPDGKIVAAGYALQGFRYSIAVARFNPDGSPDTTFDSDGVLTTMVGTGDNFAEAVAVQSDGKIIIAGWSSMDGSGDHDFTLVRYNADGSLDASFDGDGKVTTNILLTNTDQAYDVTIQSDGKIIVAGNSTYPTGSQVGAFVRYNADGSLDTTFDGDGRVITTLIGLQSVKLQPDGKIVGGGYGINAGNYDFAVVRYNAGGSPDTTFDGDGKAYMPVLNSNDYAYDVAIQPDGKIVASGRAFNSGGLNVVGLVRFTPTGAPDISFDGDGRVSVAAFSAYTSDVAIQNDGRIVVANGPLIRFNPDGSLDAAYGTNGFATTTGAGIVLDSIGRAVVTGGDVETTFGVRRVLSSAAPAAAPYDFDGDGKSDISIYRSNVGEWWINQSSTGATVTGQFGNSTDKIVPGDFSGDGKTDIAVWRPASGEWFVLRSENNSYYSIPFGAAGDIPAPADFDGDEKADLAVFRPSGGTWFINKSSGGTDILTFGQTGDVPVTGDYDRDGKADLAIWRASVGQWWILNSSTSTTMTYRFGNSTDIPVPGDYTGDGRTDSAVWRPSTGEWFILRSENRTFYGVPFGSPGDVPAPGDYDGDGRFDTAVFRPAGSNWFINRSTAGLLITAFGTSGDLPVPSAYVP